VSAKSYDFDAAGNETHTDFSRAMRIVREAGYTGWEGIEYEGQADPEVEGIRKTKALPERGLAGG
jgi:sugar phosphate isomerase/epimerase